MPAKDAPVTADETQTDVSPETRKISFEFSRSVSDGNYGSIGGKAWVQGEVPADATVGETSVALGDLATAAVAAVLDQLGIEYEADADMILREKFVPKAAPVATATALAERTFGATEASGEDGEGSGIRIMNPKDAAGALPGWLIAACQEDGITAVWDNRKTAKGNQPKFKEAIARGAEGHGKDGEAKAFWEPK